MVNPTKGVGLEVKRNDAGVITDVALRNVVKKPMWLQNAAFVGTLPGAGRHLVGRVPAQPAKCLRVASWASSKS